MKKIWLAAMALLALAACNSVIDPEQEVIDDYESPEAIAAGWRNPAFMPSGVQTLAVNAKGEVYVQYSGDSGQFPPRFFRKYSAAGNFRWERTFSASEIAKMVMGTDNKLYFVLQTGFGSGDKTELNVYNTAGSRLRNYNLTTNPYRGYAWKMLQDKDNNVYVLFRLAELVKYSPYGKELWSIRIGDPAGSTDPTEFILDAQGNIKVFGLINGVTMQVATVSPQGQLLSLKPLTLNFTNATSKMLALPNGSTAVVYWSRSTDNTFIENTLSILDKNDQLVSTHPLLLPGSKNIYEFGKASVGDSLTVVAGSSIAQFGLDGQFKKKVDFAVGVGVITDFRFFDKYLFVSGASTTRLGTQPAGAAEGFVLRMNADLSR
jgi:hypothetical protein